LCHWFVRSEKITLADVTITLMTQLLNYPMTKTEWYTINDVETLDTPALVIYPERVKKNINTLVSMIDDVSRLRPHAKTFKCVEVAKLLMDAGINKFKCATIAEAEMLAMSSVPDILLAYQPVGEKINRFGQLLFLYPDTKFSCLVDDMDAAAALSEAAVLNETEISVYIDLNVGMNRTGILPDEALKLYIECNLLPGIKILGLHAYDGHIHDIDLKVRTERCEASYLPVSKLKYELLEKGYPEPIIIAGGSPTFPIHAKREKVECSPGTFVYWDKGYGTELKEQPFLPAALVVSRVISLPGSSKLCLDVGHKSVAAENELSKRISFLNAPEIVMVGQSEEHLVVDAGEGHRYQVDDVFYGLPYHICPTVALYERAITIQDKITNGEWKNIARDRKITI
jgi:D-serine deaminase-like pyridoxal phosphate-dependent protein